MNRWKVTSNTCPKCRAHNPVLNRLQIHSSDDLLREIKRISLGSDTARDQNNDSDDSDDDLLD